MPLVCNMSSSIGTKPINWDRYGVVYASSQKNLGAAGVSAIIIREDLIGLAREDTPSIFNWNEFSSQKPKFYNTPPTLSLYAMGLNLAVMKKNGLQYY
jgi:phosphoserine aminotransferase